MKLLISILTYNARDHICDVIDRIDNKYLSQQTNIETEILIIDDASIDDTVSVIYEHISQNNYPIKVLSNPVNQGYGGNQKIGYTYAIDKEYDIVVLMHGDGQYPPEEIDNIIQPIIDNNADVVFGSRMITKGGALKGGMPIYKYLGNKILTAFQNNILSMSLSEFHSGFRAYSVKHLKKIPLQYNSNDFDFDTDIIIQLNDIKARFQEIAIPTHYGDEICNVNGVKYAYQIVKSSIYSRIQKFGLLYVRKFDYNLLIGDYQSKTEFDSTHSYAINHIKHNSVVLDIGCADGYIGKKLIAEKNCIIHGVDQRISKSALNNYKSFSVCNLDREEISLPDNLESLDYVLLLDVLEHLECPEEFLSQLRKLTAKYNPEFIISTGNIGFCITRFALLLGQFNYGKRGILDLTHKRLFTFNSFHSLIEEEGYKIISQKGIPAPIPFIIKNKLLSKILLYINNFCIKILKGLFSFQIIMIAKPLPTLNMLLEQAKDVGSKKYNNFLEDKRK